MAAHTHTSQPQALGQSPQHTGFQTRQASYSVAPSQDAQTGGIISVLHIHLNVPSYRGCMKLLFSPLRKIQAKLI